MPQITNTFLKSKMNKDLDARLIPNGEYRDAQNVGVSKSEGADVGAVENIRGNLSITDFGLTDTALEIIGLHSDVSNNRLFCFITNYSDTSSTRIENHSYSYIGAKCYITVYNFETNSYNILVQGNFLNLSKTHPIYGVNIIEDLLFWTDNRNQPRKINIDKAISNGSFYNSEDLISVLKYNPYNPIKFVEDIRGTGSTPNYQSILINEVDEYLPYHFISPANVITGSPDEISFGAATGPSFTGNLTDYILFNSTSKSPKYRVLNENHKEDGYYNIFLQSGNNIQLQDPNDQASALSNFPSNWSNNDLFSISIANPYYNSAFTGNKNFLKDKFIRFSYRFKYSDGEYSLMAPFTQSAFLPKQYGNFLNGDEKLTKDNGVIKFFENQLSTVGLNIELPYNYNELKDKLDIDGIDILYKESDNNNVKVVQSIDEINFENYIGSVLGARTARRLLPSSYTSGSNMFIGTHIPNIVIVNGNGKKLRLQVVVTGVNSIGEITVLDSGSGFKAGDKIIIPANALGKGSAQITITIDAADLKQQIDTQFVYQYKSTKPYKTLPENEITRVHDKAPIRALSQEVTGNRVMYGNYIDRANAPTFIDYFLKINSKKSLSSSNVRKEYPGQTIKQNRTYQVGIVLVDKYGRSSNVIFNENIIPSVTTTVDTASKNSTLYHRYSNAGGFALEWPGDSLKVGFNDVIPENNIYSLKNPTGWYSYKIVVKQQEQEYYNVYTPGALAGKINWDAGENSTNVPTFTRLQTVSNIVLSGDNINKVPRNLNEVGPLDSSYGSDTILYNRINPISGSFSRNIFNTQTSTENAENALEIESIKPHRDIGDWTTTKGQFYPGTPLATSTSLPVTAVPVVDPWYPYIAIDSSDLDYKEIRFYDLFYKASENPYIASISSEYKIGTTPGYSEPRGLTSTYDSLGIFETKPTFSNLNILWETTTSGLISDLNSSIRANVGAIAVAGLSSFVFDQPENLTLNSTVTFPEFAAIDSDGNISSDQFATMSLVSVIEDKSGNNITSKYYLDQTTNGSPGFSPRWTLKTNSEDFVYLANLSTRNYEFTFRASANGQTQDIIKEFSLGNVAPFVKGTFNGNTFIPGDYPNYNSAKGKVESSVFWGSTPFFTTSIVPGYSVKAASSPKTGSIQTFNFQKSKFYGPVGLGNNPLNPYPLYFPNLPIPPESGDIEIQNGSKYATKQCDEVQIVIKKIEFQYVDGSFSLSVPDSFKYETTDSSKFVWQIINNSILSSKNQVGNSVIAIGGNTLDLFEQPQIGRYTITYVVKETFTGGLQSNDMKFVFDLGV